MLLHWIIVPFSVLFVIVKMKILILALKVSSEEVKEVLFRNMSATDGGIIPGRDGNHGTCSFDEMWKKRNLASLALFVDLKIQEKSSSHVAEEMTLLSNIFRANNTITEEGKKIEITIRSLAIARTGRIALTNCHWMQYLRKGTGYWKKPSMMMEQEKASIEQMRQIASEDIASMQAAWQDEKTSTSTTSL